MKKPYKKKKKKKKRSRPWVEFFESHKTFRFIPSLWWVPRKSYGRVDLFSASELSPSEFMANAWRCRWASARKLPYLLPPLYSPVGPCFVRLSGLSSHSCPMKFVFYFVEKKLIQRHSNSSRLLPWKEILSLLAIECTHTYMNITTIHKTIIMLTWGLWALTFSILFHSMPFYPS